MENLKFNETFMSHSRLSKSQKSYANHPLPFVSYFLNGKPVKV